MKKIWEPVIGIEIHVQLKTESKMFCGSKNADEDTPNTHVCPICLGHPGTLPVLNKKALQKALLAACALGAEIQPSCKFDRKHYFYPDLPKGYQISQYDEPLARGGRMNFFSDGKEKSIPLERIQMEEDTAQLIHNRDTTLMDFNRAGTPLIEIVTEPKITTAQEAKLFAKELRLRLIYTGVTDGNMKKGHLRFDTNVSVHKKSEPLGTRVEIKNVNSFRSLEQAITYEIERQKKLLEQGETVSPETRGWNDEQRITYVMRSKEAVQDYRYFPEPDIPPLLFEPEKIERIRKELPEMPHTRKKRFIKEYGLTERDAQILIEDPALSEFFENTISELRSWLDSLDTTEGSDEEIWIANRKKLTKFVIGWLLSEVLKLANAAQISIRQSKITPENFAEFITLLYERKINSSAGQVILAEMFRIGIDPSQCMEEKNLEQVSDVTALEKAVQEVIQEESKGVRDYEAGKAQALMFLVGKVMKKTQGKANPQLVTDIIRKTLAKK